jgi:hypothetical protein
MPVPALAATCPFVRRLIVLLATDLPPSPFMTPDLTFRLLCESQEEAERYGASEPFRRAITQVCQWARDSLGLSRSEANHTRSALPTVYRTVYPSRGVTVGWASSAGSLFSAIEPAARRPAGILVRSSRTSRRAAFQEMRRCRDMEHIYCSAPLPFAPSLS